MTLNQKEFAIQNGNSLKKLGRKYHFTKYNSNWVKQL